MRLLGGFAVAVLASLTAGCKTEISSNYRVPPPLVERLPIKVGVVYGDGLRHAHVENEPPVEIDFIILAGRANVSLYDRLLSDIFFSAVPLESRTQTPENGVKLDAILEAELTRFTYAWDVYSGDTSVDMDYSYTLYAPGGPQLAQWTVTGYGYYSKGIGLYASLDNAIEIALRDAAAKFLVAIYDDASIRRCFERFSPVSGTKWKLEQCFQG